MTRLTMICVAAIVSKFLLLLWLAFIRRISPTSNAYYFCYCDGTMRNVISREQVTHDTFLHYDDIAYPVIHISRDTVYFKIV